MAELWEDDECRMEDAEMGHAIWIGILVGVPFVLVVLTVVSLVSGVSLWLAFGAATLPAFFVGPYIGGLLLVGRAEERHHVAPVTTLPTVAVHDRAA
jgi:hypothetical protein